MVTKSKNLRAQEWLRKKQDSHRILTFAGSTADAMDDLLEMLSSIRWPTDTYQRNPVLFFQEILGVDPWSKQIEILEALRDYPRVAVKSGHKVSKSHTISGASLWIYSSWTDARVVLTSTTARQVDEILWLEIRKLRARGGRCLACKVAMHKMAENTSMYEAEIEYPRPCKHSALIDGDMGDQARTGLKSADFRSITGFTAREAEAVAGISGNRLWYFPDEASGIPQVIFDAIDGNRAGGARIGLFGNPTRNEGEFYDAFHTKSAEVVSQGYHCITVSSKQTPNVVLNQDEYIPGLANPSWIREKEEEWGSESILFKVRIEGEFAEHEEGKIFPIHLIHESERLWPEAQAMGRLQIGLDPAGDSGEGDESFFTAIRGMKQIKGVGMRGLNEDSHLVHLLSFIKELKVPREVPLVMLDREGKIGYDLYVHLENWLSQPDNKGVFELVTVRASDSAMRDPLIYHLVRDELAASLYQWFKDGGAIMEDTKLEKELHLMEWRTMLKGGRQKLFPEKRDVRKLLGRSCDRFDSLALAVWGCGINESKTAGNTSQTESFDELVQAMDPYDAGRTWHRN